MQDTPEYTPRYYEGNVSRHGYSKARVEVRYRVKILKPLAQFGVQYNRRHLREDWEKRYECQQNEAEA